MYESVIGFHSKTTEWNGMIGTKLNLYDKNKFALH